MDERRSVIRSAMLVVALLGLGLVASPAQAEDTLPQGDFVATYTGTLSGTPGPRESDAAEVVLTCRAGSCTYVEIAAPQPRRSAPTAQGPSVSQSSTRVEKRGARLGCPAMQRPVTTVFAADNRQATMRSTAPRVRKTVPGGWCQLNRHDLRFEGRLVDVQADGSDEPGGTNEDQDTAGSGSEENPVGVGADRTDGGAGSGTGGVEATSSRLDSGSAGAPSVLSALPTVQDASLGAGRALALALLVIILVLLVAFPTHLLNSAVEAGHERLSAFRRRRLGLPPQADDAPPVSSVRTWALAAGVVLAASVVSAFVDPEFGLNAGSLRVLASLGLALAVETLLVWWLVITVTRRVSPGTIAGFHAAPATLVVVVLAVVLTRLTGFEPGIIFGLVAGVTFAAAAGTTGQGKVALAGTALAFGLALTGWVGYSLLGPATAGAGLGRTFLTETLSSLAIAGIASLPLALVPLRGMTGHTLYTWNRPLWATCYATGLVGFFLVLMPMPFSWSAVDTPLRTWVLLYLAYATTAVIAWAALTQPWRKDTPAPAT